MRNYRNHQNASTTLISTSHVRSIQDTRASLKIKWQHVTCDIFARVLLHFYATPRDFCSRQCSLRLSSLEDKKCRRSSRNVCIDPSHFPYIFALCSLVLHSLTTLSRFQIFHSSSFSSSFDFADGTKVEIDDLRKSEYRRSIPRLSSGGSVLDSLLSFSSCLLLPLQRDECKLLFRLRFSPL